MKRFYKEVAIEDRGGAISITLDGRPVRTPGRNMLIVANEALGEAIAEEWRAQGEDVDPRSMTMTSFASTSLDRVTGRREDVIDEIAGYAGSDLMCHWAEEPDELVARQRAVWQPLLDWCAAEFGAALEVTSGIMPISQDEAALAAIRDAVARHDDMALTGLHALTTGLGSVVIALAVVAGRISPEEGFTAALLDETYQAEKWGEDEEAATRREALRADMLAAAKFVQLAGV